MPNHSRNFASEEQDDVEHSIIFSPPCKDNDSEEPMPSNSKLLSAVSNKEGNTSIKDKNSFSMEEEAERLEELLKNQGVLEKST
jgi:hypothetical protein